MGIWSEYIYSSTPDVKFDFSQLSTGALDFINRKQDLNDTFTNESPPMTVDELGKSFCDTAKIWGYMDNKTTWEMHDMVIGFAETAEMTFKCDADDVRYFTVRFDKSLKKMEVLVVDSLEDNELDREKFLKKLKKGEITWTHFRDSRQKRESDEALKMIIAKCPGMPKDLISLAMAMQGHSC